MPWVRTMGKLSQRARAIATELHRKGYDDADADGLPGAGVVLLEKAHAGVGDTLRAAREAGARVLVAVVDRTFSGDPWSLLRAGAEDVVAVPDDRSLAAAVARVERWVAVDAILDSDEVAAAVRGSAPCWRAVLRETIEIARFTPSPVLITGETGTGKEVIARLIHALDPRHDLGDLVLVDCTTVVPSLSGSEFFGHEKGAFTGATAGRVGAFARANRGTLFLDEVGELPLALQAELLRVVQEGQYKTVGGNDWRSTTFRLVAATNRDLLAAQHDGRFRSDLYFRLAGALIHLPPLRDRIADIVPLFCHFYAEARGDRTEPEVDPAVVTYLHRRAYPGNVRDLRQLAIRVAARHVGDAPVSPGDIAPCDRPEVVGAAGSRSGVDPAPVGAAADDAMASLEAAIRLALAQGLGLKELKSAVPDLATRIALADAGGPTAAARLLGVSRRAVDYRKAGAFGPVSR